MRLKSVGKNNAGDRSKGLDYYPCCDKNAGNACGQRLFMWCANGDVFWFRCCGRGRGSGSGGGGGGRGSENKSGLAKTVRY